MVEDRKHQPTTVASVSLAGGSAMTDRAKAVADAFKQLTERERAEAYLEIEKVWRAPYDGPAPLCSTDEDDDEDCRW